MNIPEPPLPKYKIGDMVEVNYGYYTGPATIYGGCEVVWVLDKKEWQIRYFVYDRQWVDERMINESQLITENIHSIRRILR